MPMSKNVVLFAQRFGANFSGRQRGGPETLTATLGLSERGLFKGGERLLVGPAFPERVRERPASCQPAPAKEKPRLTSADPAPAKEKPRLTSADPAPAKEKPRPALCQPAPAKEESFAGAEAAENSGDFPAPLGLSGREDFSRPSRRCSARYPCRRRGYGRGLREKDEIFRESTFYDNKTRLKTVLFFGSFARLRKRAFADPIWKGQIFRLLLAVPLQIRR